jgi:hypothetical protein
MESVLSVRTFGGNWEIEKGTFSTIVVFPPIDPFRGIACRIAETRTTRRQKKNAKKQGR